MQCSCYFFPTCIFNLTPNSVRASRLPCAAPETQACVAYVFKSTKVLFVSSVMLYMRTTEHTPLNDPWSEKPYVSGYRRTWNCSNQCMNTHIEQETYVSANTPAANGYSCQIFVCMTRRMQANMDTWTYAWQLPHTDMDRQNPR